LRAQRDARVDAFQAPEKSQIRVALAADGSTEVFFPAFRNPAVALAVLGFLVLWIGLTIVIFRDNAPLIFKIAWPLSDVLNGIWVLSLLFGSTSAHARNGEITIVSRLLGIPIRQRHLELSQINDIRSGSGMYAGNTVYRRIQIHRAGNDIVSFGDGIPDSIEADWIASTIAKAAGLPDNASAGQGISPITLRSATTPAAASYSTTGGSWVRPLSSRSGASARTSMASARARGGKCASSKDTIL
jgi:hypothetical protein